MQHLDMTDCTGGSNALYGYVSIGGTYQNVLGTAYLIRKAYDPIIMDTVLTAIDSISIASRDGLFYKHYLGVPAGTLLLKIVLLPVDANYASSLPTYHGDTLR